MGVSGLLFVSRGVSFAGQTWWTLMLGSRLTVLLLLGFTLFSDEQERFVCNTIQPGCSNVCFDAFAPVSVLRLWLLHLILLALAHLLFATYVMHELLPHPGCGGSPSSLETSGWSREPGGPRFYCAYVLLVLVRILLEAGFGAGQVLLFGLSFPKSFSCYEAPCTSGVECYISRRTEKSLMLSLMLGVSSLSILLSLFDLISSTKATVRWRRRRRVMLAEELIKGEQSSTGTAATAAEDGDKRPESNRHAHVDTPPTPTCTPAPSRLPPHSRVGPPPSPRPDREPSAALRAPAPAVGRNTGQSSQQSDSRDDRRAWV